MLLDTFSLFHPNSSNLADQTSELAKLVHVRFLFCIQINPPVNLDHEEHQRQETSFLLSCF